jgi:hypothetical protein
MNEGERMRDCLAQGIGKFHHLGGVARLDEMLGIEVAVAKVDAKLDVRRDSAADAPHAFEDGSVGDVSSFNATAKVLSIPEHHLVAHIPLDCQIVMGDRFADRGNFRHHRPFIGTLDGGAVLRRAERADHRERGRQADLKPHVLRELAAVLGPYEIEIRRARLARISQFAKHNVLRIDAVGDPQLEKACARAGNLGGRKKRTGTKQRILPADPQPPPADLAVGDALEAATQDRPERAKDLRDIVEPDASYEVNVLRRMILPHAQWT